MLFKPKKTLTSLQTRPSDGDKTTGQRILPIWCTETRWRNDLLTETIPVRCVFVHTALGKLLCLEKRIIFISAVNIQHLSVSFLDGITEKEEEVVLKSNQEFLKRYSLKEPRLIIWFTDESDRIYRPTSDVTGPAMRKFPSILYLWDILWFLEASFARPLTTTDQVPSAIRVSFDSSNLCALQFSLNVSQHDVWMVLISLNTSSSLIFQSSGYPPIISGWN